MERGLVSGPTRTFSIFQQSPGYPYKGEMTKKENNPAAAVITYKPSLPKSGKISIKSLKGKPLKAKEIKKIAIAVRQTIKEKAKPPKLREVKASIKEVREMDTSTCGCIAIVGAILVGWLFWWILTKMGMHPDKLGVILGCVALACIVAALAMAGSD
jgi:hypothetical protein